MEFDRVWRLILAAAAGIITHEVLTAVYEKANKTERLMIIGAFSTGLVALIPIISGIYQRIAEEAKK